MEILRTFLIPSKHVERLIKDMGKYITDAGKSKIVSTAVGIRRERYDAMVDVVYSLDGTATVNIHVDSLMGFYPRDSLEFLSLAYQSVKDILKSETDQGFEDIAPLAQYLGMPWRCYYVRNAREYLDAAALSLNTSHDVDDLYTASVVVFPKIVVFVPSDSMGEPYVMFMNPPVY